MIQNIRSVKQLQKERIKVFQRQQDLESKMLKTWEDLKDYLTVKKAAKRTLSKILDKKTQENLNGHGILKSAFTYGVSVLARRLADNAEEKIHQLLHAK
ncbi:MAG: hypothetical protein HKN76_13965 [Saprospiraceae bacterium]|nr:hypothetical protein [Saprospiraceae bacterium]